jgi:predicted HTH transcriptional regulator
LEGKREWNRYLEERILETVCGIGNLGNRGDIFIGVADDLHLTGEAQKELGTVGAAKVKEILK